MEIDMTSPTLAQQLVRQTIGKLQELNSRHFDPTTHDSLFDLHNILFRLEARHYLRKEQGLLGSGEEHDTEARVPFDVHSVATLPVDPDGYVIPGIPEIADEVEYPHDGKAYPSGPAFFIDPETRIIVYTKEKGLEEGIMIKDIDWTNVRFYKKFYSIDDSIEEFGLF